MEERCRSPLNPSCGRRDVAVYMVFDVKRLPVCQICWEQVAEADLERDGGFKGEAEDEDRGGAEGDP